MDEGRFFPRLTNFAFQKWQKSSIQLLQLKGFRLWLNVFDTHLATPLLLDRVRWWNCLLSRNRQQPAVVARTTFSHLSAAIPGTTKCSTFHIFGTIEAEKATEVARGLRTLAAPAISIVMPGKRMFSQSWAQSHRAEDSRIAFWLRSGSPNAFPSTSGERNAFAAAAALFLSYLEISLICQKKRRWLCHRL